MDAKDLDNFLSQAYSPVLGSVISALNFLWKAVKQAQASQEQLRVLVCFGAQLVQTLDHNYSAGRAQELKDGQVNIVDDYRRFVILR